MQVIDLLKVIKGQQNVIIVDETTSEQHEYHCSYNDDIVKGFEAISDYNGIVTYHIYI